MAKVNTSSGSGDSASEYPLSVTKVGTINANNTTASIILFRITGCIEYISLFGIVTGTLSSNITAAHFRLNDQTATVAITAAAGTTLSNFGVNSLMSCPTTAGTALQAADATTNPPTLQATTNQQLTFCYPTILLNKNGANTDIEFRYSTTDAPASGEITFYMYYRNLDSNTTVVAQ